MEAASARRQGRRRALLVARGRRRMEGSQSADERATGPLSDAEIRAARRQAGYGPDMGRGEGGIAAPERTRRKRPLFEPPSRFGNVQTMVVQTDAECEDACRRVREAVEPFLERWRESIRRHTSDQEPGAPVFDRTTRTRKDALDELPGLALT